jgi:hypothetical protein
MVHVRVAGQGSTLPAASLARTENVCEPMLRPVYALGLEHDAHAEPSSLHSKPVTPTSSLPSNEKDAEVEVVEEPSAGPAVMLVSGGVVSAGGGSGVGSGAGSGPGSTTLHERVAGVGSAVPRRSTE